jgi:hypothetical protein
MRTAFVVSIVLALLAGAAGTYYFAKVEVKVEAPPPAPSVAAPPPMPDTFGNSKTAKQMQFPGQPANAARHEGRDRGQ